ncbi:MAG: DUF2946 family protein [Pseudomonadota bacterium]
MELHGKLLAFVASVCLAFTGGTLRVDLSSEIPTVTICSAHGSYEISLDTGDAPDASTELCCGACVAVDAPDPFADKPWAPLLQASSRDVVVSITAFTRTAPQWRQPPSRAPPFVV